MAAAVEGVIRACPQCGGEAFHALPDYSSPPWQIVECASCTFVYLRNPPEYKHLVSDFAWEKTRVAEVERRKSRSPIRMWLESTNLPARSRRTWTTSRRNFRKP